MLQNQQFTLEQFSEINGNLVLLYKKFVEDGNFMMNRFKQEKIDSDMEFDAHIWKLYQITDMQNIYLAQFKAIPEQKLMEVYNDLGRLHEYIHQIFQTTKEQVALQSKVNKNTTDLLQYNEEEVVEIAQVQAQIQDDVAKMQLSFDKNSKYIKETDDANLWIYRCLNINDTILFKIDNYKHITSVHKDQLTTIINDCVTTLRNQFIAIQSRLKFDSQTKYKFVQMVNQMKQQRVVLQQVQTTICEHIKQVSDIQNNMELTEAEINEKLQKFQNNIHDLQLNFNDHRLNSTLSAIKEDYQHAIDTCSNQCLRIYDIRQKYYKDINQHTIDSEKLALLEDFGKKFDSFCFTKLKEDFKKQGKILKYDAWVQQVLGEHLHDAMQQLNNQYFNEQDKWSFQYRFQLIKEAFKREYQQGQKEMKQHLMKNAILLYQDQVQKVIKQKLSVMIKAQHYDDFYANATYEVYQQIFSNLQSCTELFREDLNQFDKLCEQFKMSVKYLFDQRIKDIKYQFAIEHAVELGGVGDGKSE